MSNEWGLGTWGQNQWGQNTDVVFIPTGLSLTGNVGDSSIQIDCTVSVNGQSATASAGDANGFSVVVVSVTGASSTSNIGSTGIGLGRIIDLSGQSVTSSSGSVTIDETVLTGEGWGRSAWGSFAWGVNYSVQPSGLSLTSNIGSESAFTDVTVSVSGLNLLVITQGAASLQIDGNVTIFANENQLTGSTGSFSFIGNANVSPSGVASSFAIGNTVGGTLQLVPVTGNLASSSIGTINLIQTTVEQPTGISLTSNSGSVEQNTTYSFTGVVATSSVGNTSVTGTAKIDVSGNVLTSTTGSPRVNAWTKVDTGNQVVWSEVEKAA